MIGFLFKAEYFLAGDSWENYLGRLFWLVIYMILVSSTIFLVITLWARFQLNPTVTTLESTSHPVSMIPFPGISICNLNKISRKRALQLAKYIANRTNQTAEKVMHSLNLLGGLYDFNLNTPDKNEAFAFQKTLDNLKLDIQTILLQLTTPCDDLIQTCTWKGFPVNCSRLFHLRLTYEGYCCVFNYVKDKTELLIDEILSDFEDIQQAQSGEAGLDNGLSLMVYNDIEDYYFTVLSSTGVNVHVFVPTDFPDKASGSLIESLVSVGSASFLEIEATTIKTVRDAMSYAVEKRKCLFDSEMETKFGVYSQSDCNVDCRIKSMMALCGCLPFTIPFARNDSVCTLTDIPCLEKYKNKWNSQAPVDSDLPDELNLEKDNSLRCDRMCYPACEGTLYNVGVNALFEANSTFGNHSSIHLFYRNRYSNLYKQDVLYYWFEILSNYGGIFGLMMGVSVVSAIEFTIKVFDFLKSKVLHIGD